MNKPLDHAIGHSVCPHDCPSVCALDIEIIDGLKIGKVRGAKEQTYTAGVICSKVARYAERANHPDRLLHPMRRTGPKGSGEFEPISWEAAFDEIAENFLQTEARHGAEAVWPYHYAGTMGHVQRDGIHRLTHVKGYSFQYDTICVNSAWNGFVAGTGRMAGPDPREMAKADVVVIWGTNAVNTQVNVMTHAIRARKTRGAKIVAVDIYQTGTMDQADLAICLRPGTDGALACALMHILFRDGYADREYMARYSDCPDDLEAHLKDKTPEWAAAITGLSVAKIEEFAKLIGSNPRTFFRLGYGFTRTRNGPVNMHAALSIPTVLGSWQYEGGGGFHGNGAIYKLNKSLVEASECVDTDVRWLDQSRIGPILTGESDALNGGPAVHAMVIQNTNPLVVAPEQTKVRQGFARDDLFVAVHEQFMTDTAKAADIVLPATMFTETDDLYTGGGHQYLTLGPKLVDAPGECRDNHFVICEIAKRVGAEHRGFEMSPREHIDWMLQERAGVSLAEFEAGRWIDLQPDFDTSHFIDGFGWPDKKFHFKPDWSNFDSPRQPPNGAQMGPHDDMPTLPDHWAVIEEATEDYPFRLATSPARTFLNSSFTETPGSLAREDRPTVKIHPADAARLSIDDGDIVELFNDRGVVRLHVEYFDGLKRGVVISEGIWPPDAFLNGEGINVLTGADAIAPYGGCAFHDNRIAVRRHTGS